MKTNLFSLLVIFFLLVTVLAIGSGKNNSVAIEEINSKDRKMNEEHGLTLSDMQVKITSQGRTATFQLYDTVAAKQF